MKTPCRKLILTLIVVLLAVWLNAQTVHYVSAVGVPSNAGSLASPWSLAYALTGAQPAGKVHAGDTIYLLEGTYKGNFLSTLGFATGLPIIVKNYQDKRVTIDGNAGLTMDTCALLINGQNTRFENIEVTSSSTQRIASGGAAGSSFPSKIFICHGIEVFGTEIKLVNCIVHDVTGAGISSWKYSDNNEVYGCIVYNNGFFNVADSNGNSSERGNGPGFYLQHLNSAKPKVLKNNFVFKNFSNGIQAKTVIATPGHALNGIYLDSNTVFNGGALNYASISRKYNFYLGSEIYPANPAENIFVRSNVFYRDETDGSAPFINAGDGQWKPAWYRQSNISFGAGQIDSFLDFRSNYVIGSSYSGAVHVRNSFGQFNFQNNTLYDPIGGGALIGIDYFSLYKPTDSIRLKGVWNNNRYFSKNTAPFWRYAPSQTKDQTLSLPAFQLAMKVDLNSNHQTASMPADTAFVRLNKYKANTFFVTVLNHSKQNNYNLQLGNINLKGLYYTVVDIQNYYGPQVTSGVYNGSTIALPMNLYGVSKPVGEVPQQPFHTSAALGTFVIKFTVAAPLQPCNPPTNLTANYTPRATGIKLVWSAANGATKYLVQQKNGNNWDSIGTTTNTSFTVNNLQPYSNYNFRVGTRCTNDTGLRFSNVAKSPGRYFVATNGTAQNVGSIEQPWSFAYALSGATGSISAGDSVFIRGGVYKGNFAAINLYGNDAQPIVFKSYSTETAVIDGYTGNNDLAALAIAASCVSTSFIGIEVKSSSPSRLSSVVGDMYTGKGVLVQGHHIKIINCNVHDMPGDGIFLDKTAAETEVYGCIIYNNGYERTGVAYGSGIAVQNMDAAHPKTISNSFVFKNNAYAVFAYGNTATNSVDGIIVDSSGIFNTGAMLTSTLARKYNVLVGGAVNDFAAKNIIIKNNAIYRDETDGAGTDKPYNIRYNICLGQSGITDSSISLLQNRIVGGGYYGAVYVQSNYLRYNLQDNLFYTPDANNTLLFIKPGVSLPPVWNNNRYYSANGSAFSGLAWDGWRSNYEVDGSSSYNNAKPTDEIFVYKNKYDAARYAVTVLNYSKAATVRLPVVNSLFAGGSFEVIDAQNYLGAAIATGSYNGTYIDLQMNSTAVAAPIGTVATQPQHTSAALGTFIVKLYAAPVYCPNSNASFKADKIGSVYQWQVDAGNGFVNIANNSNYGGANTQNLQLINMPASWNNNQYRCLVDGTAGNILVLKLAAITWNGSVSNAWELGTNWDCGVVPSSNSEVIISGGNVVVNSNAACRTLTLNENAVLTVKPGITLSVTKTAQ